MNILVNAKCTKGGAIPWCALMTALLGKYPRHRFVVCVSPQVKQALGANFVPPPNVEVLDYPRRIKASLVFLRSPALDRLVEERGIDLVFTVFGPTYWRPRVPHVCGFAKSQYIYENSPIFRMLSPLERLDLAFKHRVHMASFRRDVDAYITEDEPISAALRELIPGKPVYTVPNSCNPVFDRREAWTEHPLPPFDGITLLTVSADYPHKNLGVIPRTAEYLRRRHPDLKFRFVVTLGPETFGYTAANVPDMAAEDALIPPEIWKDAKIQALLHTSDSDIVRKVAQEKQLSPAVLAGRLHWETGKYDRFQNLIGKCRDELLETTTSADETE